MYDFDKEVNRRNTGSLKWDVKENELPMWVADMDFETAPEIKQALVERAQYGVFGYNIVPDEWYQSYIGWWKKQHHFLIEKEWMIFATGIVPILSSVVRKLTTSGENVLIQAPVYNIFFNSIFNNGRNVLESPLLYKNGIYSIDFTDLEKKLSNPQTTLMILCNPHNPIGKIWDKTTLKQIGELCAKHHVIVISDEIHCDLTAPDKEYVPFASVSDTCRDNCVMCAAPTKTFNLAGIQTAAAIIPNPVLRHKVWRALNTDEIAEPNSFAITATVAAFGKGGAWLAELKKYLQENKQYVVDYLEKEIPHLRVVSLEATYLLWIDCSRVSGFSALLAEYICGKTGLYLSPGKEYGESGNSFLRLNIACTRKNLTDGLDRLKAGIESFEEWMQKNC